MLRIAIGIALLSAFTFGVMIATLIAVLATHCCP